MDVSSVWYTIGCLVDEHPRLPAPLRVEVLDHTIHIELASRSDVDAWAAYIELSTPSTLNKQAYGTIEFFTSNNGWLAASLVMIWTEQSDTTNEERGQANGGREVVAATTS